MNRGEKDGRKGEKQRERRGSQCQPGICGISVMEALGLSRAKRTANHFRSSADERRLKLFPIDGRQRGSPYYVYVIIV